MDIHNHETIILHGCGGEKSVGAHGGQSYGRQHGQGSFLILTGNGQSPEVLKANAVEKAVYYAVYINSSQMSQDIKISRAYDVGLLIIMQMEEP